MNAECLPSDRITNLPLSIIQTILTLIPIRDAFRTSILSRKWRYNCINIPKLEFDDNLLQGLSNSELSDKWRFFHVVYNVLLLHNDPVLEFSLCFSKLESCYEIDWIILYLSRNTGLEKFTLCVGCVYGHKLPSTFFSLNKLKHLKLHRCEIPPLLSSCGFSMLTNLWFDSVVVTMSTLIKFLFPCPLLKSFSLINPSEDWYSDVFELFRCLPLIEYLHMDYKFAEPFPFGITLERQLPNKLVHLRVLQLDKLSFYREDELRSVLLMVSSSTNIEKINLEMFFVENEEISQTAMNHFDLHDCSYVILDNLREMEITHFSIKKPEMDFVKLILSKSPMLKTVRIVIDPKVSVSDELKILRDLLWIPRASAGAQIKFERP